MHDYRCVRNEEMNFNDIIANKSSLAMIIDSRVQKQEKKGIHYPKIQPKKSTYYDEFQKIYSKKCAYCGISSDINPAPQFEIDHFIDKLQINSPNGTSVDNIENLIFSCRNCNQAKKGFSINNIFDFVHPDKETIKNVFLRDELYKIVIADNYRGDKDIEAFYKKMNFGHAYRKLDYLLLTLYLIKNQEENKKIEKIYYRLLELRNAFPSLNKLK
jgi:putative CRISPR-associated protein, csn1 family